MATNPFDQFDAAPSAANPFDQFDAPAPQNPKGFGSDVVTALKKGVQQLPGVATGLADIPAGLVGMDRPISKLADRLGAATGFTPGKWAKEQEGNFSQATKDGQSAIDAVWADPNAKAVDVAGAYLANPRTTALNVIESAPSMLAGGAVARGLGFASKLSGAARGAVGEGAVMAGQSMDQIDPGADPQRAAAAALATGAGGAVIGFAGGRLAQRMGVADVDTLMAGRNAADVAQGAAGAARPGFAKSIAVDAAQEALLEEAPQSALETGAQNWAEGKDLTEGMARNVVEGAVAGGVMGGVAGGVGRAMQQPGINSGPVEPPTAAPLQIGNTPDPYLSFPDGSVARQSEMDAYINGLPADAQPAARAKMMGQAPQPADTAPVPEAAAAGPAPALGFSPLAGTPVIHPDGTVTLNGEQEFQYRTNPSVKPSEAMGLDPNAGPLSRAAVIAVDTAPRALSYDNSPTGTMVAGADGVRPQGRAEVVNRQQALDEQQQADEAERQRRTELGQSPFTPVTPIDPPAQPTAQQQIPLDTAPTGTRVVGADGIARPEIRAEQISRDQAAEKVIPNRLQAGKALRDAGPGHEVVRVDGGFAVRPVQDATLIPPTQAKETPVDVPQPAKAPEETSPAPGAQVAPQTEAGGVGDGPRAQNPASATASAQADPSAAGIPGGLQDRPTGNGAVVAAAGTQQRDGALSEPVTALDAAANEAASSPANDLPAPSAAQIEAGNYKKGHINLHGLDISIENPKGSTRSGTRPDGSTWSHEMSDHYGYVKRTVGADNEQVDVYVGPKHDSQKVFVVDQMDQQTGGFDEHKAMLGFDNQMQAMRAYRSNFDKGWQVGPVKAMSVAEFRVWLKDGDTKNPANQPPVQAKSAQAAINSEASKPVLQGRNGTPLADGGKPFKQRAQADDARKLQPQMRIVKVVGGFALTEKTPAQLAAQDKAARRLAQPNTSPAGQPIAAHQFIAGEGGLNLQVRTDLGVQGNPRIGNRTLYAGLGRGMTLEQATEMLVQGGYLREGSSHSDALALIKRSLTNPQYTAEGTERMAEADKQARFEAQQAEEEAISDVEAADDAAFEYVADLDPNDDNVPFEQTATSQNSLEADMRSMGFTEEEIYEAIANESRAPQADRQDGGVAVEAASRDSQEGAVQRNPAPGEDGGLTAPSRADILAQQDRADAAEEAAKAQRRADDERARKDQERKDIAARSQAAADTFVLGGDAEQNLSGQQPMFSRSAATQATFESRIDELFDGGRATTGTRVLDSSDAMGLLGYPRIPLVLNERHLIDGMTKHPNMTAAMWKKVPQWLEDPAMVYRNLDPAHPNRLVVVAPETIGGAPVVMAIEPNPTPASRGSAEPFQLLVTVFDKDSSPIPFGAIRRDGAMLYVNTKNAPAMGWRAGDNPQTGRPVQGRGRILTEKQLAGYRRFNNPAFSFTGQDAFTTGIYDPNKRSNDQLVATEQLVDGLKEKWTKAPEVIVARNMRDEQIPQAVREHDARLKSQGATGEARGFIYRGKVYLLSDQLDGPGQIAEVLFHEVLGHYGLRGAFGDQLKPILQQVATMRSKDVRAKAAEYGLDLGNERDRLTAAEEVLAEMAQATPELGFVKRAVSAIRNWLRTNVPGFRSLQMTDADIIQAYILPARGFVTRSQETGPQSLARALRGMGAFSRGTNEAVTNPADVVGNQGGRSADDTTLGTDDNTGLPLNADGTVTVYHHTSASAAAKIRATGTLKAQAEPDVYVTTHKATDTGYGDTAVAIRVDPAKLSIDDEFPNGRKDFRLDVGRPGGSIKVTTENESPASNRDDAPQYNRAAPAMGSMTPDQERAWAKVAGIKTPPTLAERAESFKANLGLRIRQGVFDQFAPIKDVSQAAYMQARLSKGSDGTMEAAMLYGKPALRDGVPDVDINDGGFAKVLASLKGEHDRFLWWVAAQRAEKLKAEGKENLFSDQDISSLKTLNAGRMADGTGRTMLYAKALQDLNAFNDSVLQMAVDSGLIDKAAQDLFKGQPYVPFYRVMEEGPGGMTGPRFSSGLVGQQAFKKLKGGTNQLNGDLLENMLLNWSHLYSAAAKNRAAVATMDSAEQMAVAYKVPEGTKGAIKVMRDGMAEHWAVEDPYLLEAVSALHYVPSPLIKPLAAMKQVLTWSVTVNPTFKIRNLIRDSLSAIAQSDLSYNPLENVAKGWKASAKDSQAYASMLAGGGLIKFGTGESSERVRNDIKKLGGELLDDKGWRKLTGAMGSLWEAYNEFGDRTENVNRAALYERLVAKGHTPLEANFMARDLMDFSMSGRWDAVRFLAQTVPFLNARLQGLYKLGRAAKEDPRRFGTMAAAVSLASLGLLAAYGDDDDWKKREDFDRDSYWWFKIGDTAFRIPKPFEVGAIGTIAERTAELMLSDEMTGKRFGERLSAMVFQTFAMDPVPQAFKPLLDVYSNKDSFTKRAIEGQGDEKLRPQDRVGERTSEIARLVGQWGLPEPLTLLKGEYRELSPKQVDFLLRGYFSWVGSSVAGVTDLVARPMLDRGERPAMRLKDTFLVGSFVESLPSGSSRYVSQLYDQARDIEQAWTSYQDAMKRGDTEKAADIQEEEGPKLRNRMAMENAKRQLAAINKQARQIEADRIMSADQKREKLEELERRRDVAARRVTAAL